jgi:DNA polymerase III epsilon subunit-like protein
MTTPSIWSDLPRLVVLDVEGNGQQPPDLVEVACAELEHGSLGSARSWLIKPPRPITPLVRRIHGIRNSDVEGSPAFADVASEIEEYIAESPVVAHNARVDAEALSRHLGSQWRVQLVCDTLRLAKAVWPGLKSYSLDALVRHAGIDTGSIAADGGRHRASFDAALTAQLFCRLVAAHGAPDSLDALTAVASVPPLKEHDDSPKLF